MFAQIASKVSWKYFRTVLSAGKICETFGGKDSARWRAHSEEIGLLSRSQQYAVCDAPECTGLLLQDSL